MFVYCINNPVRLVDSTGLKAVAYDRSWVDNSRPDGVLQEGLADVYRNTADRGNGTITTGYTLSGAFGIGCSVSVGITRDRKGNIGVALTTNAGGGFPNASFGTFVSVTNAPTIYYQEGYGAVTGASVGPEIIAIGGEYNILIDKANDTVYHGGTVSVSAGILPACMEVHGEAGYTWVWGFNIYDMVRWLLDS